MNTAHPLKLSPSVISRLKRLSLAAVRVEALERDLYFAISELEFEEKAELLALYMLGHGGIRSFNVALAAARRQPTEFIAGMLAEKCNLVKCISLGLKRHRRHS